MHRDHEERVFRTLSYGDGVLFAALFSVAHMDASCPPRRCTPPTTATPVRNGSKSTRSTVTRAAEAVQDAARLRFLDEAFAR
ncbi:hypothetical protein [Catellatospora sp. NPDC049609]|uniref:hypothetical protein n=1 Tax=Catellatospora sp. NPDC049609 TaxID=3155505 RepID=UPI003426172E